MRNFNTRFILSLIIFSFIPILIFSQSTQTIVLNGTDSGTKNYVARDEVVFNAGYNYTPTSGNTMSASTNPELVCNTIYIPLEDAPDTHDRELDKNLEVGTTNGAFGVSPSGGATYQIAIYTPPGTNGVQPQIAIAYNSQSGTGLLGRGWNISGLSAITRVPQNQYFDGQVYMINFDENDRFALDGSRLILNTGNYGEDGSTYKTEQENFAIITYFKNISTGKDYFKVENRDGSVVEYGNTVDSNVSEPDYPILYRINRITDAFGNYISYSYYLESLESYIKKIEYTGNSNVNQLPYQSLEFIYEKKTDQRDYKFAGKIIPETVILNNILVKSNNNVIRKYNFHYSLDVYSKLISIDEFNSENDKYNSTIIKWEEINKTTDASVIQALTNINSQAPTVYKYWSTGDVNGDGLTDILSFSYLPPNIGYLPETFIQVYENQTTNPLNPSFVETEGYTTPTNIESFFTHDFPLQGQALVHNLNGDNDPDIVIPFHHHTSNINSFKLFVLKESANVPTFSSTLNISSSSMPAYTFGDLNGDGIDDLVYIEKWGDLRGFGKIRFGSSNPLEEWNNEFGWNNLNLSMGLESAAQSISIEDFDSDGLNDIICFTNYGYKVLKNLGNNQFYQIEGSSFSSKYSWKEIGDFNGDGKLDYILNEENTFNWKLALNNGNSSFTYTDIPNFNVRRKPSHASEYIRDDCKILDFNNDGKSDVVFVDAVYDNSETFKYFEISWFVSTGSIFELYSTFRTNSSQINYCYKKNTITGDFNGDGRLDLINYGANILDYPISDNNWRFYSSMNLTGNEGLVTSISDGLNQTIDINYRSLVHNKTSENKDFYKKGISSSYPLNDIIAPIYCVWKTNNFKQPSIFSEYAYEEAIVHNQGKGFLGFKKVSSSGSQGGSTSTYAIDQYKYFPYLINSEIKSPQGAILSTTLVNHYNIIDIDIPKKRFIGYPSNVTQTDINGNSINTIQNINASGNLLSKTVSVGSISTNTIFNGYNSKGQPANIVTTYSRPDVPDVSETSSYTYNSNGTIATSIAKGITTSYSYTNSPFGLPVSVQVAASGMVSRTNYFYYDALGRFKIREVNAVGHVASTVYNDLGNPLYQTDANGLIIENTYDAWGNLLTSKGPDNITSTIAVLWATEENAPSGSLYFAERNVDNIFSGATYYDKLSREFVKEHLGPDGMKFSTLTTFNDLGQVSEVSEPYPSGLEATLKTLYAYRNDGRILSQTLPNNVVINYSYLGNKTTTSYSTGEVFYKINDATGLLVESKDPGGIIKYFYESDGQPKKIEAPGGNTEFTYNSKRLQATLIDPDAGTTSYQYDGFNQLSTQISANLVSTTLTYDKLGRIIKEEASVGDIKNYLYDCMGARGKLYEINNGKTGVEESSEKYKYDALTRLTEETRRYGGEAFTFKYNYNTKGNISKVTYPAGMELNYTYNSLQELTTIKNGASLVWQRGTINSDGQIENATFGNNKQISYTYDSEKRLTGMNVNDLIAFNYEYNNKQQLVYRDEKYKSNGSWIGFKEDFTYDGANRLETVSKAGVQTLSMSYQSNMISNKSDAGTYDYASSANHRLTNVTPNYGSTEHDISYTRTGKVNTITETGSITKELAINYGVDDQRFKTEYKENNVRKYTRYFFKDFEKEVSATGAIRHLNYIYAGGSLVGIYEQKSPSNAMHYIYTDHLGSIRCITNSAGVVEQGLSYDAWGNRRNPGTGEKYTSTPTGLMFYRGYTGHEHLDELGLINMNGRVYDPAIALFLSPDNYVQSPTNSQNFNRYAYCLNNPLMFTDPTGELTWFDIGAGLLFVGGIVSEILAPGNPWGTAAIVSGFSHFAYTINGVEDEGKSWNDASTYAGINASISFDFNWPEFNQHHIVEYDPGAEYVDPITGQSYSANSGSETYDNFLANAGFYTNPGDMNYKRSYDVYFGSNYNTGFTPYIDENMYCVFENAEYLSSIHQGGFSREDYILQTMIDHPEIDIINVGLADYPTIMRSNFKWGKNIDYFTDVYRRINSGQPLSAVIPGNPYHAVTIVGYNTTTYELIYMDPQRGFYRFSINEILSLSGLIPIKRPRW